MRLKYDQGHFLGRREIPYPAGFDERPFSDFQPPSRNEAFVAALRRRSESLVSLRARATTMPPTHIAAIANAVSSVGRDALFTSRCNIFTIALNTPLKASFSFSSLRATSFGSATIGHEFSTSSKC